MHRVKITLWNGPAEEIALEKTMKWKRWKVEKGVSTRQRYGPAIRLALRVLVISNVCGRRKKNEKKKLRQKRKMVNERWINRSRDASEAWLSH